MINLFKGIYNNKTVLVTGHTGFKGSWLALWLSKLGAKVVGYSLGPPTNPNHFEILGIESRIISINGDLKDREKLKEIVVEYKPEIVFHLAALAFVRESYSKPIEAFETNVMGTLNIFETVREVDFVKALINVTSDKCYENKEWCWGYREIEPVGGYDPYSASKACSELITTAYRNSYFNLADFKKSHNTLVASCRAGNVIGGGDWGNDRLIPDIIKAVSTNGKLFVRCPEAIRPWQYILDCLRGYLMLGEKLLESDKSFAEAWNFGSNPGENMSVIEVILYLKKIWNKLDYEIKKEDSLHESLCLKLDCSKANAKLKWLPLMNVTSALEETIRWYQRYYEDNVCISEEQLEEYCKKINGVSDV
jgi:CDP-glucose 4,6-dehydratase